jgi:hypothetical protein
MPQDKEELYILKGLLKHIDYVCKFSDKIKHDYFSPEVAPVVLTIKKFYLKTGKLPTVEMICDIYLDKICKGDQAIKENAIEAIENALEIPFEQKDYEEHIEWLEHMTKEWIIKKSVENAFMAAADLYSKGNIKDAVNKIIESTHVNFEDDLGLDYFGDLEKRMANLKEDRLVIPTGIKSLDDKIGGGWRPKSLIIFGAATNVGKTLIMGAVAAQLMQDGYNGLYITLEINDFMLSNRIDANIADIPLNELPANADRLKEILTNKLEDSKHNGKEYGRLIIKEYPPASISSQNIISIVRELEMKRGGFKPDFLVVDYIGLMIPNGKSYSDNTYGKMKTVAEELRAVGSKLNIPVFSAVQVNRGGYNQEKLGLENTSDSMGIPMTADLTIMVSRNEELDKYSKMWWEIAKSRWSKNGGGLKIAVDFPHMRISDGEDTPENEELTEEQKELVKNVSVSKVTNAVPFKKNIKI